MVDFYAGTSGLVLPVPNKTHYPAEFKDKSRLTYYASLFNSIEINSSFYKISQAKTIAKWAEEVPSDFRFTFKLWRGITHEKALDFNPADVYRFMETIGAAGNRKGCLLVQFPPGARAGLVPQLQQLIYHIREADPGQTWKVALEFRHPSWYNDDILKFVEDNQLTIVIQDIPASATPLHYTMGNLVYLRFHGPGGKYRGSYPVDILREYSYYVREWREEGKIVYVYFNNTMGDAVQNLVTFNSFVRQVDG
jgi:uncharacterized protein YecE (DUF72 family)